MQATVLTQKMPCFSHIIRVEGDRLEKPIMTGMSEGKRKRGRPRTRRTDEIRDDLTMDELREVAIGRIGCRQIIVDIWLKILTSQFQRKVVLLINKPIYADETCDYNNLNFFEIVILLYCTDMSYLSSTVVSSILLVASCSILKYQIFIFTSY